MPKPNGVYIVSVSGLRFFPEVTDTETEYSVGDPAGRIIVPGTQTINPTDRGNDFVINADDGIYAQGKTREGTDIALQNVYLPLVTLQQLIGAEMDGEVLEESVVDEPPAFAMAFKALLSDGGFLLCRYYVVSVISYELSFQTKNDNTQGSPYKLSLSAKPRMVDNRLRGWSHITPGAALTWLDSIPTITKST